MKDKEIIDSLKTFLEGERLAGIEEFFSPSISPSQELELLSQRVHQCTKGPLARTKTHYVFGEGNNEASLLFVGEAPGEEEDRQGKPFVGKAGQLLTRIIQSIGLKREDVYITNILKCRPPGNRNPLPQEIENCLPYLKEQIRIIRPQIICALGKFAAQTLLGVVSPISQLRGKFYDYEGIHPVNSLALGGGISPSTKLFNRVKLIPTFHPAYLLRNPQGKIPVWEDMKKIKKELSLVASNKPQARA